MRLSIVLTTLWLGSLLAASLSAMETVTVIQVGGATLTETTLRTWTNDRLTFEGAPPHDFAIDDVLSLQFTRSASTLPSGTPLVVMAGGDRLVLQPIGVYDDELTATWHRIPSRAPLKLPLETVSAIIFDLPASLNDRLRLFANLQTLPAGADIVLLANGDRVQGDFERLDAEFVHLKSATGPLKLDRKRAQAIRLNPELINPPKTSGRRLKLALADGSHLTVHAAELVGGELKCTTVSKQNLMLPLASVVSCQIYGNRAVPLSDREPSQLQFVPFLSTQWSLIRDANVLRGPLSLRGVEYGTGLGMHSRMLATYALTGSEQEFRGTVGIDDCANGAGNVRFAIELDGMRVWESFDVTGSSPAIAVPPVKLTGAKQLTLIVDYGKNADVSDYADWCDAVLVLKDPAP